MLTLLLLAYLVALVLIFAFFRGASLLNEEHEQDAAAALRPVRNLPPQPAHPEQLELLPSRQHQY